jgi:hypothetical protein
MISYYLNGACAYPPDIEIKAKPIIRVFGFKGYLFPWGLDKSIKLSNVGLSISKLSNCLT